VTTQWAHTIHVPLQSLFHYSFLYFYTSPHNHFIFWSTTMWLCFSVLYAQSTTFFFSINQYPSVSTFHLNCTTISSPGAHTSQRTHNLVTMVAMVTRVNSLTLSASQPHCTKSNVTLERTVVTKYCLKILLHLAHTVYLRGMQQYFIRLSSAMEVQYFLQCRN